MPKIIFGEERFGHYEKLGVCVYGFVGNAIYSYLVLINEVCSYYMKQMKINITKFICLPCYIGDAPHHNVCILYVIYAL